VDSEEIESELWDWIVRRAAEIRREWEQDQNGWASIQEWVRGASDRRAKPAQEQQTTPPPEAQPPAASLEADRQPEQATVPEELGKLEVPTEQPQLPLEPSTPEKPERVVTKGEGLRLEADEFDLEACLRERGCEFIDKRSNGGALWVIGGQELAPMMTGLENKGIRFTFAPSGGRATRDRAAWWTKWSK